MGKLRWYPGRFRASIALLTWLCLICVTDLSAAEPSERVFQLPQARLTALEWSPAAANGETVLAVPWLGGAATGYRAIGPRLAEAGYRVIAVNPRGIMGSTGQLDGLTLHEYATDIAEVAASLGLTRIHMLGWAWGNRVARAVATDYPALVQSVSLLAAGGAVAPMADMNEAGRLFRERDMSRQEQLALARDSLFAPPSSDELIEEFIADIGYWEDATAAERAASGAVPVDAWWAGGNAPMLIVQGLNDRTAPPQNGEMMQRDYGDRIVLVNLADAGHMMGLEKPDEAAQAIIEFLREHTIDD